MMSQPKPEQPKLTDLQRLLSSSRIVKPLVVSDDPHWNATISIHGLGIEAYDREGNPKPNSLMGHGGFSRIYSLNIPYDEYGNVFLDWSILTEKDMIFASASKLIIQRPMYKHIVPKSMFDCKTSLGFVGNSSVALITDMFIPDQSEPIFQQMNQLVCIDRATRRAKKLPDWFKERYTGKGILDNGVIVKPLQKPECTFVYDVKVAWSDTDFYRHTNYASYVRFGVDAVHAALLDVGQRHATTSEDTINGADTNVATDLLALKGLTNEIVRNGLKSVDICYLKESLEGQRLDIHVWQDESFPCVAKCVIESSSADICHMTLEYFDDVQ